MHDEKIITLLDTIVEKRSRYSVGSSVALEIVEPLDELVAYIKENY